MARDMLMCVSCSPMEQDTSKSIYFTTGMLLNGAATAQARVGVCRGVVCARPLEVFPALKPTRTVPEATTGWGLSLIHI